MYKFTLGRRHGRTTWELLYGPDANPETQRRFVTDLLNRGVDRRFAEVVECSPHKLLKFGKADDQDVETSSSSSSQSSSSSTADSETSSSSSNSSSSSSSESSSSSSSSSQSSSSTAASETSSSSSSSGA